MDEQSQWNTMNYLLKTLRLIIIFSYFYYFFNNKSFSLKYIDKNISIFIVNNIN